MFSILGISYKHIEQLKFEDFIKVKEKIKEKLVSLQVKQIQTELITYSLYNVYKSKNIYV